MLLPLTLWSASAFEEKRRSESFTYGFYYGVLAILILYNLVLFFTLRDRSHLHDGRLRLPGQRHGVLGHLLRHFERRAALR